MLPGERLILGVPRPRLPLLLATGIPGRRESGGLGPLEWSVNPDVIQIVALARLRGHCAHGSLETTSAAPVGPLHRSWRPQELEIGTPDLRRPVGGLGLLKPPLKT